jgi:hypothetical protein
MNYIYAGIGSRNLPAAMIPIIQAIAAKLARMGFTLRSGGAAGADSAFESASGDNKEIYLPWKNFMNNKSPLYKITDEAKALARAFYPPENLEWYDRPENYPTRNLMSRNCYQVLGDTLDTPVDFIVCWTPSEYKGGTSQALRIARRYNIPYFNLFHKEKIYELANFLNTIKI